MNRLFSRLVLSVAILQAFGCIGSKQGQRTIQHLRASDSAVAATDASNFTYQFKTGNSLHIEFKSPQVVTVATKPYKWGYVQFPSLDMDNNGNIYATWSMHDDAMSAYGKGGFGYAISTDHAKHWQQIAESAAFFGGVLLPNGDRIKIYTPKAAKTDTLQLPAPIHPTKGPYGESYHLYKVSDLPNSLQGIYLERLAKGTTVPVLEHETLDDPLYVRFSSSGMFPIIWWGDMHILSDGSLVAGVYPGGHLTDSGTVSNGNVLFYRSTDNGHSWKYQGIVTYHPDLTLDKNGKRRGGFTEPAFEVLSNGTLVCIMRTTDGMGNSPMYISRSKDNGRTWSQTEVVTSKGVYPRLLQLKNGVLVLSAGRPGVQLRFSADGNAKDWTAPFEMLPYTGDKDVVSCGYTGLLETSKNSFLIIYSDFKYVNEQKEIRKAIKVREVIVNKVK